jgi:hypothetical protein
MASAQRPRPVGEKIIASSPTVTLPIFWSPKGFALVEALPKGQTSNPLYLLHTILRALHTKCLSPATGRRTLIRMDDAGPTDQK